MVEQRLSFDSTKSVRHPESVYNDIGMYCIPSQSVINNFFMEIKEYYLKLFEHLETRCDLKPASKAVIHLRSEQQQSANERPTELNIYDSETKSVEGVDSQSSRKVFEHSAYQFV